MSSFKFNLTMLRYIIVLAQLLIQNVHTDEQQKPNIILIVADDLGFNDVSFRGQDFILTPNIDALAYQGTILKNYYVPAMCTPSRTALLTGKYPIRTGMQHFVIPNTEPWGLCANEILLSNILKDAGYSTNIIGKWHLGFFKETYTPTFRGFDYHYGYMGGFINYWSHTFPTSFGRGHDFWKNRKHLHVDGYVTDLLTDEAVRVILNHNTTNRPLFMILNHLAPHIGDPEFPMQAPQDEINKFGHISDENKRIYAAMVSKLDQSIEKIIQALNINNLLNNSIIVYYSDNGAPTIGPLANTGSNYPLRGQKDSPWEGGIRSSAVIWSPNLVKQNVVWNGHMHAVDWLPTLLAAANIDIPKRFQVDGENLWDKISKNLPTGERSILHNIDEIIGYSSYMQGSFKYINGTTWDGYFDSWLSKIETEKDPRASNYSSTIMNTLTWKLLQNFNKNQIDDRKINRIRSQLSVKCPTLNISKNYDEIYKCEPLNAPCLFNLNDDPCEKYNLANIPGYKPILKALEKDVEKLRESLIPTVRQRRDKASTPYLHNNEWTWWKDQSDGNSIPGTYCT